MPPAGYPAFLQYLQSGRVSDSHSRATISPASLAPADSPRWARVTSGLSVDREARLRDDGNRAKSG